MEQRPSFCCNHVSATVGKSYSEKAYYFESVDRSTTGEGITGTESTTFADHPTWEGKGTKESDF